MIRLLITSVGNPVAQSLLDVIDARGDNLRVVGTTSLVAVPLQRCERVYLTPVTERPPSPFSQRLLDIIDGEGPELVIPTCDDDVTALADLAVVRPELAERIPCGAPETARILADKWRSFCFAREHGLAFVESAVPDALSEHQAVRQLVREVGFPLVAKPRTGHDMRRVRLLGNTEQLEAALAADDLVLQRYVGSADAMEILSRDIQSTGMPLFYSLERSTYSLQTCIQQDGTVGPVCSARHRTEGRYGTTVERVLDDHLLALGRRWGRVLAGAGWRGPVNIECRQDTEGEFVAFALDGRFTEATAVRYFLGHDELGFLLQDRLGQPPVRTGAVADWLPITSARTLGVGRVDMERLLRHQVWEPDAAATDRS